MLTTLYFICMCRKLHCKSSAMYNFNLIFYHVSHVDPTRPVGRVNSRATLVRSVPVLLVIVVVIVVVAAAAAVIF